MSYYTNGGEKVFDSLEPNWRLSWTSEHYRTSPLLLGAMKEQILKLRKQGLSYREIQNKLGCSKGTISYHCGKDQKQKTKIRNSKTKNTKKYKLYRKIDSYVGRKENTTVWEYKKRTSLNDKIYKKLNNNPYCYLTGKKINLHDTSSYQIDHIIPFSKGGDNTVENAGLCLTEINQMKSDLTVKQLLYWCKQIIECQTQGGSPVLDTGH